MKRIFVLTFVALLTNITSSQNIATKTFKSEIGHFSFNYPSNLVQQKINNAPHMLLKLDSKDFLLSISLWENIFNGSTSIWEEDILNNFLDADKTFTELNIEQSCEKVYLTLNEKKVKCLKSNFWMKFPIEGNSKKSEQIFYRLLHKGNYLQFVFIVYDTNKNQNKSQLPDNIMKGLILF